MTRDMLYYKNIFNLKITLWKVKNELNLLQNKTFPGLTLMTRKYLSNYDLYEFLKEIVLIDEFRHFNQIFKLKRNVEYDFIERYLNKMMYHFEIDNQNDQICSIIESWYAHCFDIQSTIKSCILKSNCLLNVKK